MSELPLREGAIASFGKVETERQKRLIHRFAPLLRPLLRRSERVLFGTHASRKSSLTDVLTRGLVLAGRSKACVVIFTTERMFLVPTGSDHLPGDAISHAEYGTIARMDVSGVLSRKLRLAYRDGSSETIRLDYDEVADAVRDALPDLVSSAPPSDEGTRRFLCPGCRASIARGEYDCRGCAMQFKSRREAIRQSLLIPGGGYFYTGEYFYGVIDAVVESLLLIYLFALMVDAARNGLTLGDFGAITGMAILIAIEKWVSIQHALAKVENYMPAK